MDRLMKRTKFLKCFITNIIAVKDEIEIWCQTDNKMSSRVETSLDSVHVFLSDLFAINSQNLRPVPTPEVGRNYLTHMKNDLHFHRVVVTHIEEEESQASVLFIDFGVEDWVPFNHLVEWDKLFEVEPLAQKFYLADIKTKDKEWSSGEVKRCLQPYLMSSFQCEVISVNKNTECIRVYDQFFSQPLIQSLVKHCNGFLRYPSFSEEVFEAIDLSINKRNENKTSENDFSQMNGFSNKLKSQTIVTKELFPEDNQSIDKQIKEVIANKENICPSAQILTNGDTIACNEEDIQTDDQNQESLPLNHRQEINETLNDSQKVEFTAKSLAVSSLVSPTVNTVVTPALSSVISPAINTEVSSVVNPAISSIVSPSINSVVSPVVNTVISSVVTPVMNGQISDDIHNSVDSESQINEESIIEPIIQELKVTEKENNEKVEEEVVVDLSKECDSNAIQNGLDSHLIVEQTDKCNLTTDSYDNCSGDTLIEQIKTSSGDCVDSTPKTIPQELDQNQEKEEAIDLCPNRALIGHKQSICLTARGGSERLYCQLSSQFDVIQKMTDDMNDFYNKICRTNEYSLELNSVKANDIIAARFSEDQLWYRALVKANTGTLLDLLYLDWGNGETVETKECKQLTQQFNTKDLSPQAFLCQLNGDKLDAQIIDKYINDMTEVVALFEDFQTDCFQIKILCVQ